MEKAAKDRNLTLSTTGLITQSDQFPGIDRLSRLHDGVVWRKEKWTAGDRT